MTETKGSGPAGLTPSQTAGPYFSYALTPTGRYAISDLATNDLVTEDAAGERITIEGRVVDGDGRYPGADPALANARFKGFGRVECNAEGRYSFHTVKPGRVPGPNGVMQAPHLNVGVFARGILRRLFTRIYFEDEAANASDPILALVPTEARQTLIARRVGNGAYVFDVRLQGENETVFFEA